jgi:hypothetical protein
MTTSDLLPLKNINSDEGFFHTKTNPIYIYVFHLHVKL